MPARNYHPEDVVCCRLMNKYLTDKGIKFAPEALAHQFSHEGNAKYGHKWKGDTFGFHDFEMTDISDWNPPSEFKVIYRFCDKKINTNSKDINKWQCFNNFLKNVNYDNITVFADNCRNETISKLKELCSEEKVQDMNVGNSASLKLAFEYAIDHFDDNDIVYFVEDDHLHLPGAVDLIKEGLEKADYVSLYFHPDKLEPGPNPYIGILGETCNVFRTKNSIWKTTNSTVQTFACRVRTLKEDKDILWKYNFEGSVPDSFRTFIELGKKGRTLVHPIPGRSTHCHSPWESPFIDWKKIAEGYKYEERYFRS